MPGLAGEDFGHRDALILALVRQHRAGDHVADRIDAGHVGGEMRVGLHPAALVQRDTGRVQTQPLRERTAADRQQHDVGLHLSGAPPLAGSMVRRDAVIARRARR